MTAHIRLLGAMCAFAIAIGLLAATRQPAFALAGPTGSVRWFTWSLAATVSCVAVLRARVNLAGCSFLAAAAACVVLAEAAGPGTRDAISYTIAIVAAGSVAGLAVVGVALLMRHDRIDRAAMLLALIGTIVAGPLTASAHDPRRSGCFACRHNLLALTNSPRTEDLFSHLGAIIVAGAALILLVRSLGAGSAAVVVCAGGLGVTIALALPTFFGIGRSDSGWTRLAAVVGLLVIVTSLLWTPFVQWRNRRALAQLVVRIADAPTGRPLEESLALVLRDPTVRLRYPLDETTLIDARGITVEWPTGPLTSLERDGHVVAKVEHAVGVLDDPDRVRLLMATAGLAIEHEHVAAVLVARAAQLDAARRHLIEATDGERRALERDLHDHAQQRLVSIMIETRLGLTSGEPDSDSLERALRELHVALDELRTIGHGIFPALLSDEGLAASLEEYSMSDDSCIVLDRLPHGRADEVVEATAYLIATGCQPVGEGASVRLALDIDDEHLHLTATDLDVGDPLLEPLEVRTLALGGTWATDDGHLEVTIPCG